MSIYIILSSIALILYLGQAIVKEVDELCIEILFYTQFK